MSPKENIHSKELKKRVTRDKKSFQGENWKDTTRKTKMREDDSIKQNWEGKSSGVVELNDVK